MSVSRVCAFLLAVAIGSIAAAQTGAPAEPTHNAADFAPRILAAHNAERMRVGAPLLRWSTRLAADAQLWAKHLGAARLFAHAPEGKTPFGENLWMGTRGAYQYEEMVQSWVDERSAYRDGPFPNVSRTSNWEDVGHYTQLIWANTREVGCALVSSIDDDYLVCRYDPAGNWMGERAIPTPHK